MRLIERLLAIEFKAERAQTKTAEGQTAKRLKKGGIA